jgi:membrane dipeptidase
MSDLAEQVREIHRTSTVVDVHAHTDGYLPRYAARVFRQIYRRTMPDDVSFGEVLGGGVHALVAKAIGDPMATRWWGRSPWQAVAAQFRNIEAETYAAGGLLVRDVAGIRECRENGRLAVMLGLEGGDAIGHDLERLDRLRLRGVRLIGLVHLGHNQIGTTCLPWQEYIGGLRIGRPRRPGLTPFGRDVVARMNQLGLLIDTAHADSATLRDVLECSAQPIVVSHTGARSLQEFKRYLDDGEIRAVAEAGGLVGLWPYRGHDRGVSDVNDLVRHAQQMAGIAGPEHLCLGTDLNGLPGVMAGYRGEQDVPLITAALLRGGFTVIEVEGILGVNFLRLLAQLSPR